MNIKTIKDSMNIKTIKDSIMKFRNRIEDCIQNDFSNNYQTKVKTQQRYGFLNLRTQEISKYAALKYKIKYKKPTEAIVIIILETGCCDGYPIWSYWNDDYITASVSHVIKCDDFYENMRELMEKLVVYSSNGCP